MKFEKVRLYVSSPRIDRFLVATGNKTKAVKLYAKAAEQAAIDEPAAANQPGALATAARGESR